MKQRLLGLLALVLCLSLLPVTSGLAYLDVSADADPEGNFFDVTPGYLISSGCTLSKADYSVSGTDDQVSYYNGIAEGNATPYRTHSFAAEDPAAVLSTPDNSAFEAALWAVANTEYVYDQNYNPISYDYQFERVPRLLVPEDVGGLDDNYFLAVFSDFLTCDSSPSLSIADRKEALRDAKNEWNPDSQIAFYQIGIYEVLHPNPDIMRPMFGYCDPVSFTLPYPAGINSQNYEEADFRLFHLKDRPQARMLALSDDDSSYSPYVVESDASSEVDRFFIKPTEFGLEVTLESFSPYALAYTVPDSGNAGEGIVAPDGDGEFPVISFEPPAVEAVPQTGDSRHFAMWLALALVSIAGMVTFRRRKRT